MLFIATALTGLALLFSKNERLEECYEPLAPSRQPWEPLAGRTNCRAVSTLAES